MKKLMQVLTDQSMARKRMIDPTIWQDEEFGDLSAQAKLLFIGLFSNADDEGRIRANTAYLKSTIFMYDNIDLESIGHFRDEVIETMKTVQGYVIDGKEYIQLKNWDEYQKQHKDRIQSSTLPPYREDVSDIVRQSPRKISKDKISKDKIRTDLAVASVATQSFGNPDINSLLEEFKTRLNLPLLDGTVKENRQYANLVIKKAGSFEKAMALIELAAQDEWYKNNLTSLKALYYNIVKLVARKRGDSPAIAVMPKEVAN